MGSDIHIWCEIKVLLKADSKLVWETVGKVFKSTDYDSNRTPTIYSYQDEEGRDIDWINEKYTEIPFQGRHYGLFAILANVRNGSGYSFVPIAMPKGVPEDASDFYKHEVEKWGGDGHSHSWLTLDELENFNWDQSTASGYAYRECVGTFLTKTLPELQEIRKNPDVLDLRLVFFFDN